MKNLGICLCFLVLAVLGCVPSLHPLYNDSNTIFDEKMLGLWKSNDPNWQWEFEKNGASNNKDYEVKIKDEKGKEGIFNVHLVKIEDSNFFDFYPAGEPNWSESDFYKMHLVAVHTFMKITPDPNGYILSWMGGNEFQKKLKVEPTIIRHEEIQNDTVILTASTDELIEFMKKYSKEKWIFSESFGISRQIIDTNLAVSGQPQ